MIPLMNKLKLIVLILFLWSCSSNKTPREISSNVNLIEERLKASIKIFAEARNYDLVSPRSASNGMIRMVPTTDWTSGFFAGELWMMYELTSDSYWKEKASQYTLSLENEKWNSKTHDIGIKMYCSFGKAWENTKDPLYREILIQSAKSLASRFKPNIGCIRSLDYDLERWDYPVTIDNMMSLELLFWAAKETGNELFREIAVENAKNTMTNHFREDYSSYQVADYNPETGEVQARNTISGYSDESAWSRGQAYGLYGFTMVYRETGDKKFLYHAENIAAYILNHPNLSENKIPYWDFNAPDIPNEPYDASAAAIIASALYELSSYSTNKDEYILAADKILETLFSDEFLANPKDNYGFLLRHSTGAKAQGLEVDTPIIYADYYFLEAFCRSRILKLKNDK
nr:glycoside hydrolase family 88 protein [uncultured Draconibacterium sp.]